MDVLRIPTRRRLTPSEISPTAALVRLRGGILGVDLVHEIAKAYLMPGAGNGKGAGSDGGGNVGAPGETDGDKGGRAGGVARVSQTDTLVRRQSREPRNWVGLGG